MSSSYNFVVFSHCFPPLADPESYCTARFVSALAAYGHRVTVVAPCGSVKMDRSVYEKLVDSRVRVVPIPVQPISKKPFWSRIRYLNSNWSAINTGLYVETLKNVLLAEHDSILITRAQPVDSLIVGWYCRKLVRRWVVHLSDPIPGSELRYALKGHWLRPFAWFSYFTVKFWVRRCLMHADALSVTCEQVLRYFKMMYPVALGRIPSFVATHIGDFKFRSESAGAVLNDSRIVGKVIVHPGVLFARRQGAQLLEAVNRLNTTGFPCTLLHVGGADREMSSLLSGAKNVVFMPGESIVKSSQATQRADVVFVPNFRSPYGYSLWLMSKFVYQVYEDKPIVIADCKDSPMHDFALKYPESGILWADIDKPEAIADAFKRAFRLDPATIDRTRIRQEFSAEVVARKFTEQIDKLFEPNGELLP